MSNTFSQVHHNLPFNIGVHLSIWNAFLLCITKVAFGVRIKLKPVKARAYIHIEEYELGYGDEHVLREICRKTCPFIVMRKKNCTNRY